MFLCFYITMARKSVQTHQQRKTLGVFSQDKCVWKTLRDGFLKTDCLEMSIY